MERSNRKHLPNDRGQNRKIHIMKTIKLKDSKRRSRYAVRGWGKGRWNCNLHTSIPESQYISDKNGNIYLLFYKGKRRNLIKIRVFNPFNSYAVIIILFQ